MGKSKEDFTEIREGKLTKEEFKRLNETSNDTPKYKVFRTVTKIPAKVIYDNIGDITDEVVFRRLIHKMFDDMSYTDIRNIFQTNKEFKKDVIEGGDEYEYEVKMNVQF